MARTANIRKVHLAHWNLVTKLKALGGLGIHAMRQLNSAHLTKLGWRFMKERDSLSGPGFYEPSIVGVDAALMISQPKLRPLIHGVVLWRI